MVSRRKFHVLVVDDGEGMTTPTVEMLERLGYSAQGETQSLAALKAFSEDPDKFDLAIVEPVMPELPVRSMRRSSPITPELTGLELAMRFRRIRPGFPVLLYTEDIKPSLEEEIRAAGLGAAILKPLGLKDLKEAVGEGLRS
ncbi:MAG: sensory box histidine kinase/response regulator protein [Deltaproteobacteria bacterium]|nr:sensory box histidine kinase/response regulator protein [Deltaproteobacteria bacterium]